MSTDTCKVLFTLLSLFFLVAQSSEVESNFDSATIIPVISNTTTFHYLSNQSAVVSSPTLPPTRFQNKDPFNQTSGNVHSTPKATESSKFSIQIYIIFFIGIMPAAISALVWWAQNLKCRQRSKVTSGDIERISRGKGANQLAYRIVKRAELLNQPQPSNNGFVQRRVYSLELPRRQLEMVEIIGEGNFGQVWKAKTHQYGSANLVAVKTNKVNAPVEQNHELLKELDIMLQLGEHPNVIQLLGCCTENEPYYLVMEYMAGGKLLSLLREQRNTASAAQYFESHWPPPPAMLCNENYLSYYCNNAYGKIQRRPPLTPMDLLQFIQQICNGMEFISSQGIIHRDLAARNILVDGNRNCKVADFGLSRSVRDKELDGYEMKHSGQMPIRWMSPESLSRGLFTTKSDVWAFGILVWEIVTLGSTPYIGMSAQDVIHYIRNGNVCSRPEHCDEKLYDLMRSCWAYNPEHRFTFAEVKRNLLEILHQTNEELNYIDLEQFNNSRYYFQANTIDEKV